MKKYILLTAIFLAATGMATAQTSEDVSEEDVGTGFFGPDSILYPAQVAVDNVLNTPAENTVRRALEAKQMSEAGNMEAANRAINETEKAASKVDDSSEETTERLSTAMKTLSEVKADDNAREGINNAKQRITQAQAIEAVPDQEKGGFLQDLPSQAGASAANIAGKVGR